MSRTYRAKTRRPGTWVTHEYEWVNMILVKIPLTGEALKKAVSMYHSDTGWHRFDYCGAPSWWWSETFHRPNRSIKRKYISDIMKLVDYEDVPEYKFVGNKPKEYYW